MPRKTKPLWRCPQCGRDFVFRTREHSCTITTVADHLARTTPTVRELFGELERWLEGLDGCKITPVKTAILFSVRVGFGGVQVQKNALHLTFFLDRPLKQGRVLRTTIMGPDKLCHHLKMATAADFDVQIQAWLREAHALARR